MKRLYYSNIQTYINYGIESWHRASQSATSVVQVLSEKAISAVFNLNNNAHTNEYFKKKFILKCNETDNVNLCCYLYIMLKSRNKNCFAQYLRTHSELHNHNTRNNNSLITVRINLYVSQNASVFQSIKSWNSLSSPIKNSSNIYTQILKILMFRMLLLADR